MLLNANLYLYVYIQLQLLYVFNIVINVNLIFNNASMLTSFSYAKSAIHFWHFCHFLFSFCVVLSQVTYSWCHWLLLMCAKNQQFSV